MRRRVKPFGAGWGRVRPRGRAPGGTARQGSGCIGRPVGAPALRPCRGRRPVRPPPRDWQLGGEVGAPPLLVVPPRAYGPRSAAFVASWLGRPEGPPPQSAAGLGVDVVSCQFPFSERDFHEISILTFLLKIGRGIRQLSSSRFSSFRVLA